MFPGMPKIDPKKMQSMMKQMGINQEDIEAERVIIETSSKRIIIENPTVQKIKMQGQVSWQITGESHEESTEKFSDSDVELVMEKTSKSKEEVITALEESDGDIAEAIMNLSE